MKFFIVLFFVTHQIYYTIAQDSCLAFADCESCAKMPNCGWCGPTATCLNGTRSGPSTGKCYGDSWYWGESSCPDCTSFTNCKECLYWDTTCFWCESIGKCKEWGTFIGCLDVRDFCPCEVYSTCSECLKDPACNWCGGNNNTCVSVNDNCPMRAHTCPCADNLDCDSCLDDLNQGCTWCENEFGIGMCKLETTGCTPLSNCNSYCANKGPTCDVCTSLPGCAWCTSESKCVDPSVLSECKFVTHTCPNCGSHHFCDSCQDEGCVWCQNGECRQQGDLELCSPVATGQCSAYCGFFSDCNSCNVLPGCGWCEDTSKCVDMDVQDCMFAHTCSASSGSKCKFDGGAFVGGMFLGIGLVIIGIGGFLFYKWKTSGRNAYNELK